MNAVNERPYRVHVVVDSGYRERTRDLPADEPVWIVDSPDNHPLICSIREERPPSNPSAGITSFTFSPDIGPEDRFIRELPAIDLHHGECSHKPPYSILNVIGTRWSSEIQEALEEFGFLEHEDTTEGFVARRTPPERPG